MSIERLDPPSLPRWLERELPFTRYRINVGGERMHVMEAGEGRPVLMVHGNPTWGFLYRKIASELQGEPLRVVVPDLIGLGFSDKPRSASAHTLDNHARWLGELIRILDLRDLILVVQDWGGAIGVCALADQPERIAAMVVLNTALSPPKPGFRPTTFHRFANTPVASDLVFRVLGFPQVSLWMVQGNRTSIRGNVARAYRYPLRRLRDRIAPLCLARMVPGDLNHPSVPALRRCQHTVEGFRGPAAIVWGDRDPILGRVRNWIHKLLPQASMTRTEAGHFIQEEEPRLIASAVREVAGAS